MVTHLLDIRLKTGTLPSFVKLASLVIYRKELLMAERKREIQVKFWVTPEEKKMIRKKWSYQELQTWEPIFVRWQ